MWSDFLPPEVRSLYRREQEIAGIVYRNGLTTAKAVESQLPASISNAAVRSMLNRLVRKGILLQGPRGTTGSLVYAPALTESFSRQHALMQFAEDFCEGSFSRLFGDMGDLLSRPASLDELLANFDRALPRAVKELAERTREIATVVYRSGMANVREIQATLEDPPTTSCVRTLLDRLETRAIVRKRPSGRHREIVYLPGLVTRQVRRIALKRLIDGRFGASTEEALQCALEVNASLITIITNEETYDVQRSF